MFFRDILLGAWLCLSLVAGCATGFSASQASPVSVPDLIAARRIDTTDHMAYFGSDANWHYVYHSRLFGSRSLKVDRRLLQIEDEFNVGDPAGRSAGLFGEFIALPNGSYRYERYKPPASQSP